LLCAIKAITRQAPRKTPGRPKRVSLFIEVEQRYVTKFFVEERMNGVEIIDRLSKHYGGDALQRTQVYYWIKEVKLGERIFQKSRHWKGRQMRESMTALRRRSKRILIFQRKVLQTP
jgi:hypothetical protein